MSQKPTTDQILQSVEALRSESIEMLKEIVSHPSVLGGESSVQLFMEGKFKELQKLDPALSVIRQPIRRQEIEQQKGFSPTDWPYYDDNHQQGSGKVNIIATRKPKSILGKSLILNGHVDVVPTGPEELWTVTKPFVPVVKDGRLYGRGAGDMKAGVVAFYQAYKALARLGWAPASEISMQTVVEEECTGNGALLSSQHVKADAVVIPEPFDFITTAQLGVMWLRITVFGKSVHVLNTSAGSNSIEACFYLYSELKKLEEKWNAPEVRHPAWKNVNHPINFNLGTINGGDWASSVPSKCTMEVRIGYFPDIKLEDVRAEVETMLKAAADLRKIHYTLEYVGFQAEGCTLGSEELFDALSKAHHSATGIAITRAPITCTTDARFFQLYHNIPAVCYGPEAQNIHGFVCALCVRKYNKPN